jgi:transcriptional activator HAC1
MIDATSSTPAQPQTIKMEDVEQPSAASGFLDIPGTSTLSISSSSLSQSVASTTSEQKPPPKKRKSWGQVLPEPKTNLPPRKRAKTADEKEQRRIERVKRNRLAAHNSRERKRQEVDALLSRSDELERQLQQLADRCKALEAENARYRHLFPQAAANSDLDVLKSTLQSTLQQPPQPLASISHQMSTPSATPLTGAQSTLTSPDSLLHTIDTPMDSFSEPATPRLEAATETDLTHHSAVSVGFSGFALDAKALHFGNDLPHAPEHGNMFDGGDFNLFVDDSFVGEDSFGSLEPNFDAAFDLAGSANALDYLAPPDELFSELHAGSGATSVSDEPGTAAETELQTVPAV